MMTNKTASELRQEANEIDARVEESFQRCDTDGFLSQWAGGICANERRLQAEIVENGGVSEFPGLYEGDRRVAANLIDAQFGTVWILRDDEARKFGRKFIPFTGISEYRTKSRVQSKLGLRECAEMAPAKATIKGTGHGLSGNAWAAIVRTDNKNWGLDAKLVTE